MKRWLFCVLWLWLVCVLVVIVRLGLGDVPTSPAIFNALQIAECDGVPCVQGVVLGVTLWPEVKARFARPIPNNSSPNAIAIESSTLIHTIFVSDDATGRVSQISISTYPPAPNIIVGDLVTQYGAPCKTRVWVTPDIELVYPHLVVSINIPSYLPQPITRLDSKQIVYKITCFAQANACELAEYLPDTDHRDMSWQGFAALRRYFSW